MKIQIDANLAKMTVMAPEREVQEAFQVLEPIVDDEGGIKAIDVVKDLVKLVFFSTCPSNHLLIETSLI